MFRWGITEDAVHILQKFSNGNGDDDDDDDGDSGSEGNNDVVFGYIRRCVFCYVARLLHINSSASVPDFTLLLMRGPPP